MHLIAGGCRAVAARQQRRRPRAGATAPACGGDEIEGDEMNGMCRLTLECSVEKGRRARVDLLGREFDEAVGDGRGHLVTPRCRRGKKG